MLDELARLEWVISLTQKMGFWACVMCKPINNDPTPQLFVSLSVLCVWLYLSALIMSHGRMRSEHICLSAALPKKSKLCFDRPCRRIMWNWDDEIYQKVCFQRRPVITILWFSYQVMAVHMLLPKPYQNRVKSFRNIPRSACQFSLSDKTSFAAMFKLCRIELGSSYRKIKFCPWAKDFLWIVTVIRWAGFDMISNLNLYRLSTTFFDLWSSKIRRKP